VLRALAAGRAARQTIDEGVGAASAAHEAAALALPGKVAGGDHPPLLDGHSTGPDDDPDLNACDNKQRARSDAKGRSALKKEEEERLRFRDSQPENAREKLTERRAVGLRARGENSFADTLVTRWVATGARVPASPFFLCRQLMIKGVLGGGLEPPIST